MIPTSTSALPGNLLEMQIFLSCCRFTLSEIPGMGVGVGWWSPAVSVLTSSPGYSDAFYSLRTHEICEKTVVRKVMVNIVDSH